MSDAAVQREGDQVHPFDKATFLAPGRGEDEFFGHSGQSYAGPAAPYGGVTAATALNAVMRHSLRQGDPIAMTVNFAMAIAEGPLSVQVVPERLNRSTQHWHVTLRQRPDAQADDVVVLTGTVMTAIRRQSWSEDEISLPSVSSPESTPLSVWSNRYEWLKKYEMRAVTGDLPDTWDDSSRPDSAGLLWARDNPPRKLDFLSLAALCDIFPPRIWLRRARLVPTGTVSMTAHFHASEQQLEGVGTDYVLGQARADTFRNSFFNQTGHLWDRSGALLASTHHLVYFKDQRDGFEAQSSR